MILKNKFSPFLKKGSFLVFPSHLFVVGKKTLLVRKVGELIGGRHLRSISIIIRNNISLSQNIVFLISRLHCEYAGVFINECPLINRTNA